MTYGEMEITGEITGAAIARMVKKYQYCDAMTLFEYRNFMTNIDDGSYGDDFIERVYNIATMICDKTDVFEDDDSINHAIVAEHILNECVKFSVEE